MSDKTNQKFQYIYETHSNSIDPETKQYAPRHRKIKKPHKSVNKYISFIQWVISHSFPTCYWGSELVTPNLSSPQIYLLILYAFYVIKWSILTCIHWKRNKRKLFVWSKLYFCLFKHICINKTISNIIGLSEVWE